MLKRTIIGIALAAFVFGIIYLAPIWAFCLIVVLFVGLGQFEFFKMVSNRDIFVYKYFGTIVGTLIPIVIYMGYGLPELKNLEPFLIVVASLLAFTLQFTRKDNAHDHLISTALTLFSLFYISWFFSFIIKLRFLANGSGLVTYVILVTKSTDVGAYFIGSRFGRTELIPRISPKKTKEGTISGIVFSVVVSMVAGSFLTNFSLMHLGILGAILSTIGQVGDLAESLIKRDCRIKDSGKLLGGMGGILDVIDSLLFTVPIFYLYIKAF